MSDILISRVHRQLTRTETLSVLAELFTALLEFTVAGMNRRMSGNEGKEDNLKSPFDRLGAGTGTRITEIYR